MACLDENTITAFIEGSLSDEAQAQVDAHVDECASCRRLLSAVAPLIEPPSALQTSGMSPTRGSLSATGTDELGRFRWAAAVRVGTTLRGKWRLERLLGVGGTAAVYAARHVNHGGHAAIKIIHKVVAVDSEERRRFLREGYAANAVGHPGIVRVLDDDVDESGAIFLVSELVEGETLHARLRRLGPMLPDEVLRLAEAVLDILAAAHERGIVHRDIKPENIFACNDGGTRLLDFGIARIREATNEATQTTALGIALGTPAFMPPEQALGRSESVGPRSDLWALGATMFTLVTGRFVHGGSTVTELLRSAIKEPAPPLASVGATLPAVLCAVVDRALSFAPEDRFASALEMREAVRSARAAVTPDDEPLTVPERIDPPPATAMSPAVVAPKASGSRLRRFAVVLAGVLCALVLGGWSMRARWLPAAASTNAPAPTVAATAEPKARTPAVESTVAIAAAAPNNPANAPTMSLVPSKVGVAAKPRGTSTEPPLRAAPRAERVERATPTATSIPAPSASTWLDKRL
jgi:serine/threonine-protein kinase